MGYLLKSASTARPLLFLMIGSTDHLTGKASLTPTVVLSKNGADFGAPAGAVSEVGGAGNGNGWYKVAGNATDTATTGPLLLHATSAGADPTDVVYEVVAFDPDDGVRLALTALPNAVAGATNGLLIAGSNAATTLASLTVTGGIPDSSGVGTLITATTGAGTGNNLAGAINRLTQRYPAK